MAEYTVGIDNATLNGTIALATHLSQDTIWLPPGTYNLTSEIDCEHPSGWTYPVLIRGTDPNNRPVLNGASVGGTRGVNCGLGYPGGSSGTLTFKDVIIEQFNSKTQGVVYNPSAVVCFNNVLFRDCDSECIRWFFGSATRQATADKVKFLRTGIGFRCSGTSSYITVKNCDGYFNLNKEAVIGGVGSFHNCSFSINSNSGSITALDCQNATNMSIRNRGSAASYAIYCPGGTYKNCNTSGTFTNQAWGTINGGSHIFSTNPLFTDEANGDFTPQTGSPLINAGFTDVSVTTDINGTARPQGANYDIGSVEKVSSTTVTSVTPVDIDTLTVNLLASIATDASASNAANFTVTPTTGAAVSVASAANNANPMSYITLQTSVHTNGATYNLAWTGVTGLTNGNTNYVAVASMPEISSATMTGKRVIRVVFSRPMLDNAALVNTANYSITPSTSISSVVRVNATTVDVTVGNEIKNASPSIAVSGPTDLASNAVNDSQSFSNTYAWISSITVVSDNSIRVNFSNATFNYLNPQVTDEANYVIARSGTITGVALSVQEVIPNVNGTYVTLILDKEQTTGQVYSITISNVDEIQ